MNEPEKQKTAPTCIGVIMDGNRRWARANGLPTLEGHRAGYECLLRCRSFAKEKGIPFVVLYAFSTENWHRGKKEVLYLVNFFRNILKTEARRLQEEHTRVMFIGERSRFPEDIQELMREVEQQNTDTWEITLVVALSYGGRAEIVSAARKACSVIDGEITEETFAKYLWTADIPDPDLIIRSGGGHRLSNFLLWQAAYAELYFTDVLWPDFNRAEFEKALSFFAEAKRNFGT